MKVHFKQATLINKKTYKVGVHDVHESVIDDHYFKRLQSVGLVVESDGELVEKPKKEKSPLDLKAEQMLARNKSNAAKVLAAQQPKAEELKAEDEALSDEPKSKKKKK